MNLLDRIISYVAPYNCVACQVEGYLLCSGCEGALRPSFPERCYRCNKLSEQNKTCKNCRRTSKLTHVWVRSEYKGIAKELVHQLKFGRAPSVADLIGTHMANMLQGNHGDTIIMPVPTATTRRRQRGYDQSVLISRRIARITGLPMYQYIIRLGQTRQVGSRKTDRMKQLQDAYRVTHLNQIRGKHIIIVDDVLTTGATLESVAKILRGAGASRVDALVFARA